MTTTNGPLPETVAMAFKEWKGVCNALADGRQILILRKGGIEEGPGGFSPEHPHFWLYPTFVHQAEQGLKPGAAVKFDDPPPNTVELRSLATVEFVSRIETLDTLWNLDSQHVWTFETIEKRFAYRTPGLWLLGVRIRNLPAPVRIEVTPEQLGCKTWVPLEQAISTRELAPALSDLDFEEVLRMLRASAGLPTILR